MDQSRPCGGLGMTIRVALMIYLELLDQSLQLGGHLRQLLRGFLEFVSTCGSALRGVGHSMNSFGNLA